MGPILYIFTFNWNNLKDQIIFVTIFETVYFSIKIVKITNNCHTPVGKRKKDSRWWYNKAFFIHKNYITLHYWSLCEHTYRTFLQSCEHWGPSSLVSSMFQTVWIASKLQNFSCTNVFQYRWIIINTFRYFKSCSGLAYTNMWFICWLWCKPSKAMTICVFFSNMHLNDGEQNNLKCHSWIIDSFNNWGK